ncbi:MAG: CHAT domain-containing protein [Chloroflexi bacterium]|jgi:tetratricopeptide (TPR) repeat protein|nr:CHAT domain-containing protein [Chloroflexota bacterium]
MLEATSVVQAYLDITEKLFTGEIDENALPTIAKNLPVLSEKSLYALGQHAENTAPTQPRRAWAIAAVTDAAAQAHPTTPFIQALAAWYLGRAANYWVQPKRVSAAIARARKGFDQASELGWMAACDWQANALAWTKPNVVEAAEILEKALEGLTTAGMDNFVPHCRLSLAYAQIMTGQYETADQNIQASEAYFIGQGDTINQARCWFQQASRLRRQSRFEQAIELLEQAMSVFQRENLQIDIAHTYGQLGLIHLLRADNLSSAVAYFESAAQVFREHTLDLLEATSQSILGSIHVQKGQLSVANEYYQQARIHIIQHAVPGLLADNLNDSGKLNARLGLSQVSLTQYQQAEEIYRQLGLSIQVAIAVFNQGEVYGYLGRYQDSLYYLERAKEQLTNSQNYLRLGTCKRYMAATWLRLGNFTQAHQHLDQAIEDYETVGQKAYISSIYLLRADILFKQSEFIKSVESLEQSLTIANEHALKPQAALAQRLLGEVFTHTGEYERAQQNLEAAYTQCSAMEMLLEQTACLVALGRYYLETDAPWQAQAAFQQALALSQGDFPESDWQAQSGLAELAETQGQTDEALQAYRQGWDALAKIRHNFWQPSLAGSYLQTPARFFDQAIRLSAQHGYAEDALTFIDDSKATTLLRQLAQNHHNRSANSIELETLRGEINWLHEQLREIFQTHNQLKAAILSRQMRSRLAEKTRQYDALLAQLERQGTVATEVAGLSAHFDLDDWRVHAEHYLGQNWLALDYYLTETELFTVIVTPTSCQVHIIPRTPRLALALENTHKANLLSADDLAVLGAALLPAALEAHLTPKTVVLLSPHRELHELPWAALQPGFAAQPFIKLCIPCVVPSLQSLRSLWERAAAADQASLEQGLVVGLSRFPNGQVELPAVRDEMKMLQDKLGPEVGFLLEEQATWGQVQTLREQEPTRGLSRFAWLHFAGHAFSDPLTGRMGGFTLWDGDIRLDQLQDLHPLPQTMIFSACNSIFNYLYAGDEPVGLPTTSLIAGASRVIGSIWPILDHAGHDFTEVFYRYYRTGVSPAQAVALAQRTLIEHGAEMTSWASFTCVGLP